MALSRLAPKLPFLLVSPRRGSSWAISCRKTWGRIVPGGDLSDLYLAGEDAVEAALRQRLSCLIIWPFD